MPCYQVNTVSVEFHAQNFDLLREAADSLGLKYVMTERGTMFVNTPRYTMIELGAGKAKLDEKDLPTLNALKRAYTRCTIHEVAREHRMVVVEDEEDPDHLILRSYE